MVRTEREMTGVYGPVILTTRPALRGFFTRYLLGLTPVLLVGLSLLALPYVRDLVNGSFRSTVISLQTIAMPADTNWNGDIFGGWVMSQVDIAGSIPAAARARGRVATVAVNSFVFKQPVLIGDVVSFYSTILRVGRTSITVDVEVFAQRNPRDVICVKVTEASLTYVAVGPDRRPRDVPPE